MKSFVRAVSGVLLCALLLSFTLWRNDAFPDLSGFTAFIQDTMGRFDSLSQIQEGGGILGRRPADEGATDYSYSLTEELDPELEATICEGMLEQVTDINIAAYGVPDKESLQAVVTEIRFKHPELFFLDKTFSYIQGPVEDPVTGDEKVVIKILSPHYLYEKDEVDTMMVEYNAMVEQIAAGAPADGSDFDKLLYLHDYFVQNYCYDFTYTIRDAYTFFKEKTGVCQAYMLALIATAQELGIQSIPVTSTVMNHAWNLVELDGTWYHVDVTWDDAVSYPSYTSYAYFLQSDTGLVAIDADRIDANATEIDWHCEWVATKSATDTKYDDAAWRNTKTPMIKENGIYYCVKSETFEESKNVNGGIYSGSDPAAMTRLFYVSGVWRVKGSAQVYVDCYAGLAIYGDELIYNTNNTLRAYHLSTGQNRLIGILDLDGPDSIFGICGVSSAGVVSCVIASTATGENYEIMTYSIR